MTIFPLHMDQMMSCNLELGLSPPSSSPRATAARDRFMMDESSRSSQQQLTTFNHGGIPVADFTELQARAIIIRATKQMEESRSTCRIRPEATSPAEQRSQELDKATECGASLSMKRSLQRFLQKRKHRIQALSPYSH